MNETKNYHDINALVRSYVEREITSRGGYRGGRGISPHFIKRGAQLAGRFQRSVGNVEDY